MSAWHDLLILPETLLWAWRKVRRAYGAGDSLYDQAEFAAFELNLEAELESIRADFVKGRWLNHPLRLVPQPKSPDKLGLPRMRQYFEVAVRDQVAWAAIATVFGPELDRKMPAWSYGNRLYRAAWYEADDPHDRPSHLNIGPYRHAAGHLYRHFKHSWPLYRRHISLTARQMVHHPIDVEGLDEGDRRALDQSEGLAYLNKAHWARETLNGDELFAVSFDLRTFYPSILAKAIQQGFDDHVGGLADEPLMSDLIGQMLTFQVDASGVSDEMKAIIQPPVTSGAFSGIPTGLFIGGFLANVAMLSVDLKADRLLRARRNIAHFRFVDDHEVLAYDFGALLEWIQTYVGLLSASGLGVEIEPDKYVPAELKWVLHSDLRQGASDADQPKADLDDLIRNARTAARLDGRKPTSLMTRTLAQVSMLAATDFDLLTDAGRNQRLEQLEWLLLANIPDQEIRADTRMAFAAARIARLTPTLFRPSDDLLDSHRDLQARLDKARRDGRANRVTDEANASEIESLKEWIVYYEASEADTWRALLRRHFGLLFEAFSAHPEKVRLFLRLIDFCRSTGHDGLKVLADWMEEEKDGMRQLLRCYLGAIAVQTLSRHVLTACADLGRTNLLHRDRLAARSFLESILRANLDGFVPLSAPTGSLQHFQHDARQALIGAFAIGAAEIENTAPDLASGLRRRSIVAIEGEEFGAIADATRVPIGVWYHWFLSSTRAHRDSAPYYWPVIEAALDVENTYDWIALRRYPTLLPTRAWERLARDPELLKPDDAGWLIVAARSNPAAFAELPGDSTAIDMVRTRLASEAEMSAVTVLEWAALCKGMSPNDPRKTEWTALEIVRQVLLAFTDYDGPEPDEIDRLHPENVLIDHAWLEPERDVLTDGKLTWAGWRQIAGRGGVRLDRAPLEDYRYREVLADQDRRWARRLRPIGQLLWGLLRHDFDLPCAWNIRGQERSFTELVSRDLERLPISSFTLQILQACLLPRSLESAFVVEFPALFGNRVHAAADDTEFDSPIESLPIMIKRLERTQAMLTRNQMTVLAYEPRQLIPVRLRQLAGLQGEDIGEGEDI